MRDRTHTILLVFSALAGCLFLGHCAHGQVTAGLFDELEELYPDSVLASPAKAVSIETARGTIAGVHIRLAGLAHSDTLRFGVTRDDGRPISNYRWFRMIDVFVSENTGLDSRTEKFSGQKNPYVIRRAPFRIFEAMAPVSSPLRADSAVMVLRLEVPVDSTLEPGRYAFTISIETGSTTEVLQFSMGVHRATVPPVSQSTVHYVNWHSLENLCADHGVGKWTEPFWDMLTKYAQMMVKGRQNTFWFHWKDFFTFDRSGSVTRFRRDTLERYIRTFLGAGMHTIQGSPITRRRDWASYDMLMFADMPDGMEVSAISDTGKRMISQMAVQIIATMKENGWESRWLQGIIDEPTDEYVDRYREVAALLRSFKPDLPILEATMTVNLSGTVSVWCPQVQEYQARQEFFEGRKAAGDRIWVYTCLIPGGPWLNRLLDEERLRQVYIGWACAKYNLQGFLHWGLNFHGDQPYEGLVRIHGGPTSFLPAGDSHILYPAKQGPLSSQRFEAHRIGMEDCELLTTLKSKDPPEAEEIIDRVVQAFDRYSTDLSAYREAKALLLKSLDRF